jgi:hypothetical protein
MTAKSKYRKYFLAIILMASLHLGVQARQYRSATGLTRLAILDVPN